MTCEEIRRLYAYEQWANRRMIAAVRQLSAEEFRRDLKTSFRSVRGTLLHVLASKCYWLELWQGDSLEEVTRREAGWEQAGFEELAAIEARWSVAEHDVQVFLAGLSDERLKSRMVFQFSPGPSVEFSLADMMHHVVNHSTYHRGQVITLLRQLGHAVPATDFLDFLQDSQTR